MPEVFKIIGGSANPKLVAAICAYLNMEAVPTLTTRFSDGETRVRIDDSVRDCNVYVIQPTSYPTNDNLMELYITVDGLRRASAGHITAVIPYFGYARQDKKVKPREPITARLVASFLEFAGVDRIIAIDVHSEQIQGFVDIPFDHLYAGPIFGAHFESKYAMMDRRELVVVSPDISGTARASNMASHLKCEVAIIQKHRPDANVVEVMNVIGDVRGKHCLMIDDMVDTGGSLVQGASALIARGANCVDAVCTHAVLSGDGSRRIKDSVIESFVCLDTIAIPQDKTDILGDKLSVLTCADLLGQAIHRHFRGESVSSLFHNWRKS